jgi:hypothetical protein
MSKLDESTHKALRDALDELLPIQLSRKMQSKCKHMPAGRGRKLWSSVFRSGDKRHGRRIIDRTSWTLRFAAAVASRQSPLSDPNAVHPSHTIDAIASNHPADTIRRAMAVERRSPNPTSSRAQLAVTRKGREREKK